MRIDSGVDNGDVCISSYSNTTIYTGAANIKSAQWQKNLIAG